MKRFVKFSFVIAVMVSLMTMQYAAAASSQDVSMIKDAISEYKEGNYLGCISDLRIYLEEDPSNVVAWYYLGNAYMKISMKTEAHEAFDKVVQINSVPKLTSYSIQAKMCMENKQQCKYQDFTNEEIRELRANPSEFLTQYFDKLKAGEIKGKDVVEIEKLIKGGYGTSIHPDAQDFIMQQKTQSRQSEMNTAPSKAHVQRNEKLAQEILLMKQRQNQDISAMAMFLNDNNYNDTNRYMDLLESYQNGNRQITPEMINYSMMQNMLPNF